jgi:pimeloyl-ACP methyl ester carboxylesterase
LKSVAFGPPLVQWVEHMAPESLFVELAYGRMHYLRWGRPDGTALLLLHGVNQTCHSWDEVAPRFGERGTVIAVDQRGHGMSAWAKDGDYSLGAMVEDLVELTGALSLERLAVVGMSMGAANAIALAARRPEEVSHLVVVDFAPQIEQHGAEKIRHLIELSWPSFEAAVEQVARFNPRRTLANIRERLRHGLVQRPDGSWTWRLDPALLRHPRFRDGALAAWDDVGRVRCPTLVVRGAESDVLSPEMANAMLERLPAGRLVTIPGAGHSVAGDSPDEFCQALLPFLSEPTAT